MRKKQKINDRSYFYDRGVELLALRRYDDAISNFDRSLAINMRDANAWYNRGNAYLMIGNYHDAIASYDRAIEIEPDGCDIWFNRGVACLNIFAQMTRQGRHDLAEHKWNEALDCGRKSGDEDWLNQVSEYLFKVIKGGNLGFIRELISGSMLREAFFPLARAIDYLQTGEDALIEKLSPEVRGIVEEVVAKLRAIPG